jgi:hypothetical protein
VKKRWWALQRRNSKDSPFFVPGKDWYTLRRYSDLSRARRGLDIDQGGIRYALSYFDYRIIDEETGEEVPE